MKSKIIAVSALAFALLFSLAGCSNIIEQGASYAESIDQSVQLPSVYSITYEVDDGTGTMLDVTKAVDSDGNIYCAFGGDASLFIREGNSFTLYTSDSSGVFQQARQGQTYTAATIDEMSQDFTGYTEKSLDRFLPTAKSNGTSEVAGRPCEVYRIEVGFAGFTQTYIFNVDTETGICLGWYEDTSIGDGAPAGEEPVFRCVEFITEGVELPIPA